MSSLPLCHQGSAPYSLAKKKNMELLKLINSCRICIVLERNCKQLKPWQAKSWHPKDVSALIPTSYKFIKLHQFWDQKRHRKSQTVRTQWRWRSNVMKMWVGLERGSQQRGNQQRGKASALHPWRSEFCWQPKWAWKWILSQSFQIRAQNYCCFDFDLMRPKAKKIIEPTDVWPL